MCLEIVSIFVDQIFLEREIEKLKQTFLSVSALTPVQVFRLFDKQGKGFVNVSDFKDLVKEIIDGSALMFPSSFNVDDLYLVFRRYDKDLDGKLTYPEFEQLIQPVSS